MQVHELNVSVSLVIYYDTLIFTLLLIVNFYKNDAFELLIVEDMKDDLVCSKWM